MALVGPHPPQYRHAILGEGNQRTSAAFLRWLNADVGQCTFERDSTTRAGRLSRALGTRARCVAPTIQLADHCIGRSLLSAVGMAAPAGRCSWLAAGWPVRARYANTGEGLHDREAVRWRATRDGGGGPGSEPSRGRRSGPPQCAVFPHTLSSGSLQEKGRRLRIRSSSHHCCRRTLEMFLISLMK